MGGGRGRRPRHMYILPLESWTIEADKPEFPEAVYGEKTLDGGKIREKLFRNKNDMTTDTKTEDPRPFYYSVNTEKEI